MYESISKVNVSQFFVEILAIFAPSLLQMSFT